MDVLRKPFFFQPFSESIFGDAPAPAPAPPDPSQQSNDLNFDPFGLNDPLPKQDNLLTPQLVKEDGKLTSQTYCCGFYLRENML